MAANLGQAFLGAGGIPQSLAQELASSTFHEARESFHDYIYSKLILGDDKGPGVMNPNVPVFPNSNLANSYPAALPPGAALYNHTLNNTALADGSGLAVCKPFVNPQQNTMQVAPPQKPPGVKKKSTQPQSTPQGHLVPGNMDSPNKVKKKSHHKKKEKTNVCDVCGRGFAEKYTLNRHMLTHTHVKPFSCSKCNMSFSRSDGLAKHMGAGHRRIDAHHCDVCGGTFNSEVSFEQHRREYGNTLPFVCNLCMLAFSQCCHLNYHMKSHSLSKMNDNFIASCQEDKNNAIDVSELIPEDFTPPKKKDSFSGFLFNVGKSALKRNGDASLGLMGSNIVIKPEIDDMPTCTQLTGPNSSLVFQALNSHSSGHINMASSISSTASSYLPDTSAAGTSGMNAISDVEMKKYFDIKIPNPKFLEGAELHPVGVGEDGLFRCEICGKGFTRKYHMQRHVKLHTRGPIPRAHLLDWTRRPYACGVCKMGFTRQHHLTRHMLIHTGERPHSCHVCGKAFRRYTNLSLHVRTVHGAERPFKCHICGRGFPRLYSLQRHLKLHAKNAALIALDNNEQIYKGFKPVGTVNAEQLQDANKSSAFSSTNPDSTRQSPGHGHESSSDHSDEDSEKYDHESSINDNSLNQSNQDGQNSPHQELRNYNQNQAGNENFNPQQPSQQNNNQGGNAQVNQGNGRLGSQSLRPPSHEQEMINRMSRHEGDGMRRQTPSQNNNYGHPSVMQTTNNNDRFNTSNTLSNQNIRNMEMPVSIPTYTEMEIRRDATSYQLNQRSGTEGFNIQRIQSPHAILTSLERPGSRSMISQAESFHHNQQQANFNQQQVTMQAQQRVSMDLSSSRSTMSPAGMHEGVGYSHSHHLDLTGNRAGLNEPPAYPHPHNVGSIQFTTLYPQQITDHLELQPNTTASPMPVNNHSNNIQY
ncbi:zinc finger protein 366-like [Biomphalaria glabrata]|uniref:Zinc finger protein 366-like n=1 Tax=Biomphalaria glabrata TaxID=6526 RepID=A0A9U8DYS3_BIOGL|nr:zinc finger protein 366-like [Biomphalaria glabrata]XP_013066786.2 zinc finger protein 366-like [Biomphalaria glabrata]